MEPGVSSGVECVAAFSKVRVCESVKWLMPIPGDKEGDGMVKGELCPLI